MQPDGTHTGVGDLGLVGDEQQGVAGLCLGDGVDRVARGVGEVLGERRLPHPALLDPGERHALDPEGLGEVRQAVELRSRQPLAVRTRMHLDDAAGGDRALEDAEAALAGLFGDLAEGEVEAQVGLVDPIVGHRVGVGHPLKRGGEIDPEDLLPDRRDHPLHDRPDLLLVDERHLDVDLGELGLAILAQVLVAEAADDLEVALEARDHQQLLVDLRRLGERVEAAGVEPRRDHEVARAPRRVLGP